MELKYGKKPSKLKQLKLHPPELWCPQRKIHNLPLAALDTESTGLDLWHGCRPFFVSLCIDNKSSPILRQWEFPVDPKTRTVLTNPTDIKSLQEAINTHRLVFHNAKFDIRALHTIGIHLPDWDHVDDTHIASHVLESGVSHKLKDLAIRFLDINDEDQSELQKAVVTARRIAKKKGWRIAAPGDPHWPAMKNPPKSKGLDGDSWWAADMFLPKEIAKAEGYPADHPWHTLCENYCHTDTIRTLGLWWIFEAQIEEDGLQEQYELRRRNLEHVYNMEQHGITSKKEWIQKAITTYSEEARHHQTMCLKLASNKIDNLEAPKQLQSLLYGTWKCPIIKETESSTAEKPNYSTDVETLDAIYDQLPGPHPAKSFIRNLVAYKKRDKAVEALHGYLLIGIPDSRPLWMTLHPNFNIPGTDTTRLASYNPNAQNIAKRKGLAGAEISKREGFNLRKEFGPAPGRVWYSLDYSNIELRIFGYACGDQKLIDAFERGESVHLIIAKELFPREYEECQKKGTDFKDVYKSTLYQWTKNGNFSLIYGAGEKKADNTYHLKGAYRRIRKQFPMIDKFMREKHEEAVSKGYVTTIGGYRLQVPHGKPHKAVNFFVQGTAGLYMNQAIVRCGEYFKTLNKNRYPEGHYHLIMTIHDELVFDFPTLVMKSTHPEHPVWECKRLMELSGKDLGIHVPVEVDEITENWSKESPISL